jgi:hypothetical protein
MFGKQGSRFFVNSGHAISKDKVKELFGLAAAPAHIFGLPCGTYDGSIPWAMVEREIGPDAILGQVTIRRELEELYAQQTGKAVTAERARQLKRGFKTDEWNGLPVTRVSSLNSHVAECATTTAKGIEKRSGNLFRVTKGS